MKKKRRILSTFLAACMVTSSMVGMSATASAGEETSSYTITIPATLNVSKVGWNPTDGISATGTLDGKKLTVTASSANGFKLKSGSNEVGYTLTTAEGGSQTTSWEFTELSNTETKKPLGIIVEDYSTKPAGTYTDTVTFTAKVENAVQAGSIIYSTTSVNKKTTDSAFTNTLTKTGDGSVTYSIAGDNVATINASTGEVTLSGNAGTATITATVTDSENYTYATKTATYTLTVEKPTTLADAFENGAVVKVEATNSAGAQTYIVQGSFNGSNFVNVEKSGTMTGVMKTATMTKSGNSIIVTIECTVATYGTITLTFDTTNNTYTVNATGTVPAAPTKLGSISVNGKNVSVSSS